MAWPVAIDPVFGCVLYQGRLDRDGYGMHGIKRAHIVAWEREHGKVPSGMQVEHMCMRRNCTNHLHLMLATPGMNLKLRRGRKGWARRVRMEKCRFGHPMADAMVTPESGRICRSCHNGQGDAKGEHAQR